MGTSGITGNVRDWDLETLPNVQHKLHVFASYDGMMGACPAFRVILQKSFIDRTGANAET